MAGTLKPGILLDGLLDFRLAGGLTAAVLLIGSSGAEAQAGPYGPGRAAITLSATVLDVTPTGDAQVALGKALLMGGPARGQSRLAQIRVTVDPGDPERRIATINFLVN